MPSTTPKYGIPYPVPADKVNDPQFMMNAMQKIDLLLGQIAATASTGGLEAMKAEISRQLADEGVTEAARDAVEAALGGLGGGRSGSQAVQAVDPWARTQTPGLGWDFRAPQVVSETRLLSDTDGKLVDGARFFSTPMDTQGVPGSWPERWIAYVAGHDSPATWLVTAPDLLGPWTRRDAVVGIPGSGALLEDDTYTNHVSSPDAMLMPDGTVRLWAHGPLASNHLTQPTSLYTSTDGRKFTRVDMALPTEWSSPGSAYRTSTSYACMTRADGQWHAIWQGTTGYNSVQGGATYIPMPVGHALSLDGLTWILDEPLLPGGPLDQGLFAPGFIRLTEGWLVVGSYRTFNDATPGVQDQTVRAYFGPDLHSLRYAGDIVLPGAGRTQALTSPKFVVNNGKLYMIGSSRFADSSTPWITALELDWS